MLLDNEKRTLAVARFRWVAFLATLLILALVLRQSPVADTQPAVILVFALMAFFQMRRSSGPVRKVVELPGRVGGSFLPGTFRFARRPATSRLQVLRL